MSIDKLLNLLGVDIFAAADDHILKSACDSEIALGSAACKVAGVKPAVLVDCACRSLRHFVIALHDVVAAGNELTGYIVWTFKSSIRVNDFTFDFRKRMSDRRNTILQGIIRAAHCAAGRGFRLTVNNGDFGHVHLIDNLTHL